MLMGPSCAGKSTLSKYICKQLNAEKKECVVVDFDEMEESVERLIAAANEYLQKNINVIIDTNTYRDEMEEKFKGAATITKIIVTAPLEVLLQRDEKRTQVLKRDEKKAFYARHFVIESFHQSLAWSSDLIIDSFELSVQQACEIILNFILIEISRSMQEQKPLL
jgi:adenylylsulfate kinase-like enzyme